MRSLLLAAAALVAAPAVARPPATPQPAVAPLAFTERTLANGLRVYAIRDAASTDVSVQVWYDVGSKNDPQGRSGFAHLFEHLMFKATRNLPSESFDRLTEDVGGFNNASTNDDYTNYYETVPANHLERLLFAEADRMAGLVVDQASFASERQVVEEELRLRVLAEPYGKLLYLYYPELSYTRHPYARPGIGSIADLDSASLADVRAFHATYYRPDNAVVVVAGNFDPAQLNAWVDKYFAPIARPAATIPRVTVAEPVRTAPVTRTVYEANTPLPAVLISYPVPQDNDPDQPALQVLNAILSAGESSRLYESLVYRQGLAQSAETILDMKQSAGALAVYAIIAGGKPVAAGEAALHAELAKLRDAPVSAAELAEAKNQIVTTAIKSRETVGGRASALAGSVLVDGDPRTSDRQLAAVATVTAADVQRVARKYLVDAHAATIRYLPAESAPAGAKGDSIAVPASVVTAPLIAPANVTAVAAAAPADRAPVPAAGAPVSPALPSPVTFTLANNLPVVVVERHDLPLVSASVVMPYGAAYDPAHSPGLHALMMATVTKGTTTRSATDIARAVEALGGSIGGSAGWDGDSIDLTVKTDGLEPALEILGDVAQHATFADTEVDRAKAQAIDSTTVAMKDPMQLARLVAMRVALNDSYGHPLDGTPASLRQITARDVRGAYNFLWRGNTPTLVLVGDITVDRARQLAEHSFGGWRSVSFEGLPLTHRSAPPPAPRVIVVDMPGAGQAGVVVARPGISRDDPRYFAATLANAVLGNGYSARLNAEIRVKRGLSYGASSAFVARRAPGVLEAETQTKNQSAAEVVSLITDTMRGLAAPVTTAELDTRKAALIGDFGRGIETDEGLADTLGTYISVGVPFDQLGRFIPSVAAVSPGAVQQAAPLFDPAPASIVVVGEASQFVDALRRTYPQLEVIPAAAVKLDSPMLK